MPPEPPPPSLRLTLDADALAGNWRALNAMAKGARSGAAVKADAYGTGVDFAVPALREAGCRDFFVAHWSEVAGVICHVPPERVAVLHGPTTDADAAYARATGVRPVINSLEQAQRWTNAGGGPCQLMVDTGINRLGVSPDDLGDEALSGLEIEVALSHLACADEYSAMNAVQLARARAAFSAIGAPAASLANSAGVALGPDYHFDLVRPGLALYGGVPRPELADAIRPVVGIEAAVLQTRTIAAGETVGYNATFTADRAMQVAVISLGYADGYLRAWSGIGAVRLGGADCPVLGRVSMDMVVCDVSGAGAVREGDWASLVMDLPRAARLTGLSQYELLTVLGDRFAR